MRKASRYSGNFLSMFAGKHLARSVEFHNRLAIAGLTILVVLVLMDHCACSHTPERDDRSPFSSEPGNRVTDNTFERWMNDCDAAFQRPFGPTADNQTRTEHLIACAHTRDRVGDCLYELDRQERAEEIFNSEQSTMHRDQVLTAPQQAPAR